MVWGSSPGFWPDVFGRWEGVVEMASAVKRDGRAVVTTCGGCYADCAFAARVEDGRVVAELPVPGHPCAARALCAADGIAWQCRLTSATEKIAPCEDNSD